MCYLFMSFYWITDEGKKKYNTNFKIETFNEFKKNGVSNFLKI